MQSEAQNTYTI